MKTFSTPNDIKAKNWIHLQELLFKDSYDASINRHRSNYVFRGLSNSNYELEISIYKWRNQFALFSVMPDPELKISDWLKDNPGIYFRIIIPKEFKWEIRDKLDQANITERVIYPGLDGLARWLKRWYSNKN